MDWLQIKLRSNLLCNRIVFTSKLHSTLYSFENIVDLISRLSDRQKSAFQHLNLIWIYEPRKETNTDQSEHQPVGDTLTGIRSPHKGAKGTTRRNRNY